MKKQILLRFRRIAVIGFLCLLGITSHAQTPNWLWAKSACGTENDEATSVAVDALGNTYVTGFFESPTISFDSTTLTNVWSSLKDIFLAKYDTSGNVLWAISAGGTDDDYAISIAADDSGNTYITGWFSSPTLTLGATTLTNTGVYDIFLAKYDPNGNVLWAKSAGGAGHDRAYSVAIDASGNAYVAGHFQSTTVLFGSITLTNAYAGYFDVFLAKYDASGNILWAKSAGGTGDDKVNSVAVDASGNAYLAGYFYSLTLPFGTTTLTNVSSTGTSADMFLAKYDNAGNVLWAKSAGGVLDDYANSVVVNASGNAYVAGDFNSPTIAFNSTTLTNAGYKDIYLTKYDSNGNMLWAKGAGGTDNDKPNSVALDASGNIYMTGFFKSPALAFVSTTLTSVGYEDIFIAKYDASGNDLWAKSAGGADNDEVKSVVIDASGNTYVTGFYSYSTIIFGSIALVNCGIGDMFLAKLESSCVTGINELGDPLNISVFPNPATDNLIIEAPQNATIELLNIEGQLIKTIAAKENITNIDISGFSKGMYFVKIKDEKWIAVKKFVKG